jgi:hypothetical protein
MITIEQISGVGIHAHYAIKQDGTPVATMRRYSYRTGWTIYSVHYRERFFILRETSKDINAAKETAIYEITYPTAEEVYETICQYTEDARRVHIEKEMAREMAQLARDLAAGSNSAQARLIEVANEIEAFAKDRSVTEGAYFKDGTWYHRSEPIYPSPPDKVRKEEVTSS